MKHKKLANRNIGIDLDPDVIESWSQQEDIEVYNKDALKFLKRFKFTGNEFIYADPPYLLETRTGRYRYKYEFSRQKHEKLLNLLKQLPCKVMISGYWSEMYEKQLKNFRRVEFQAMTRAGKTKTEYLWMNYAEPTILHDYRYLGSNFRERELITRKKKRLVEKFRKMTRLERQAILAFVQEYDFENDK